MNAETTYKIRNATVRIHGTANQDNLRKATEQFAKQIMICRNAQEKDTEPKTNKDG